MGLGNEKPSATAAHSLKGKVSLVTGSTSGIGLGIAPRSRPAGPPLSSAHGVVGSAFKSGYVAAEHGIVGLTKVIALETAEKGITCNAICPGHVYTPLVEAQIESQGPWHPSGEGYS